MEENHVIAVWGPPGAGKTTVAARLAMAYAAKKENVILLLCDPLISGISQLLLEEEAGKQQGRTLGHLLPIPSLSISERAVLKELVVSRNSNLALLGYRYRETAAGSFSAYGEDLARQLITRLRTMVDRVIIDCSADVLADLLSTVSLVQSDKNVMVCCAAPKDFIYYDTVVPILADSQYGMESQIIVLNQERDRQELAYSRQKLANVKVEIPFSEEQYFTYGKKELISSKRCPIDTEIELLVKQIDGSQEEEPVKKKHFFSFIKNNNTVLKEEKNQERDRKEAQNGGTK